VTAPRDVGDQGRVPADIEDPLGRVEVRRAGNRVVLAHTATGNRIALTRRQAAAVVLLIGRVRDEITEDDG
jgi:hypothetical protein